MAANKVKLTQEQIDNIQNYASEIKTLKDFVEAVRKKPGMYIGPIGNLGFINMIREIFQNAYDEMNKDSSPCNSVIVSFDERTFTVIIEDNGRGIPFGHIIRIFQNQHTSSNYDKKPGEYSSGTHGVGSKVTNALSKFFKIESYNSITREGRVVEFTDGYPWDLGEKVIPNPENKQGTIVTFVPDMSVLGQLTVTWKEVYNLIDMLMPLSKKGSTVYFNAIDLKGKEYHDVIKNDDGIFSVMVKTTPHPLVMPISLFKDTGYMKMDIMFTYDAAEMDDEKIMAFSNSCPIELVKSTPVIGFREGLAYFFTNYMNKVFLVNSSGKKNKKELKITAADTRVGLKAILNVAHLEPNFTGQAKEILSNEDMQPFIKNGVIDGLEEWSKNNPKDFAKVCRYLKDVAELRMKQDKEKVNLNKKYNSNTLTGLPSKYVAPLGKKDLELWIVEGDSAAGTIKNNRDNKTQGYFPIRGKMPNAFEKSSKEFLDNAEVAGIINIIGGGYGKNFDISKVKWDKIIFGADADADGAHICALLLRFFILYMPELIKAGKVYKAVPPLYGLETGKKTIYFTERIDYIKYVQKLFAKNNNVSYVDDKPITQTELTKILYINADYTYELHAIANRYAVDPELLETLLLLHLSKADYKKLKSAIEKKYRFIKVTKINNVINIQGSLNGKIQTLFYNQRVIDDCSRIINILNKNKCLSFKINGKTANLYEMMAKFDESSPKNIRRFKGLGEMDGESLNESTLNKDNRTLIQYTLEDVNFAVNEIRYYEDNKEKLLEGIEVSRFDVIG